MRSLTNTLHPFLFVFLLAAGALALKQQEAQPILMGAGDHRYEWVEDWLQIPEGVRLGNTHGCIVVDSKDRIYLNTDGASAVVVLAPDGSHIKSWGAELKGGLHGMQLVKEGEREVIWMAHTGLHQVLKADLDGNILMRIGWPEASGIYENESQYRPTSVVVSSNGELFVADGYGLSWIHRFQSNGEYSASFGGKGKLKGELNTPHGLMLDQRNKQQTLLVADRENHRLQSFDLKGEALEIVEGMLRRPCHVNTNGKDLVVADLAGRVTILDAEGQLLTHLGDNPNEALRAQNQVDRSLWRRGEFISPHCANWDSKGNLYVLDWVSEGRITKLKRIANR